MCACVAKQTLCNTKCSHEGAGRSAAQSRMFKVSAADGPVGLVLSVLIHLYLCKHRFSLTQVCCPETLLTEQVARHQTA